MALSDELLEQIGTYLSGRMATDEKDRFEARMRQDPVIRQEVALQQELKEGLSFLAQKERFKQMHADLEKRGLLTSHENQTHWQQNPIPPLPEANVIPFSGNRPAVRYGWGTWAMAASIALLLGVGWILYRNQTEKRQELVANEQIFRSYFSTALKPAPVRPVDPDRLGTPSDNTPPSSDSIRLYQAVRAMQQAALSPVISELTALSKARPGHWSASAQWYLALAYIRNNQRTEAKSVLKTITLQNGHPYQSEAQQLLKKMLFSTPQTEP